MPSSGMLRRVALVSIGRPLLQLWAQVAWRDVWSFTGKMELRASSTSCNEPKDLNGTILRHTNCKQRRNCSMFAVLWDVPTLWASCRHIPEDGILRCYRHENIKSYISQTRHNSSRLFRGPKCCLGSEPVVLLQANDGVP
jgi:hypothetical protein